MEYPSFVNSIAETTGTAPPKSGLQAVPVASLDGTVNQH